MTNGEKELLSAVNRVATALEEIGATLEALLAVLKRWYEKT